MLLLLTSSLWSLIDGLARPLSNSIPPRIKMIQHSVIQSKHFRLPHFLDTSLAFLGHFLHRSVDVTAIVVVSGGVGSVTT
jgi:hypothetical protein